MGSSNRPYWRELHASFSLEIEQRAEIQAKGVKPAGLNLIDVRCVDLHLTENCKAHNTNLFEQTTGPLRRLIIRRGQSFDLTLHLSRRYDEKVDALAFDFSFGEKPSVETMTKRIVPIGGLDDELSQKWGAKLVMTDHNSIVVRVQPGASTAVGEWRMSILAGKRVNDWCQNFYLTYVHPEFIFILFNPWCKNDTVYLNDEALLQEYVLNDQGAVFQSSNKEQYQAVPWNYGQFEDVALYSALIALRQNDHLTDRERSDPVLIARRLTHAINDKVLWGRWSEPYTGGTEPWRWTGTPGILEKYLSNPEKAAKFGQCWVFSAVFVTLCRTLGLPCRSVTNIRSAHDTDRTLTIDRVYVRNERTKKFEPAKGCDDSIWNFHVWNEVWMKRNDLAQGYDGWQACDATPQEMSEGVAQCGPMPVEALRKGEVNVGYDGWFIFGETNADVVSWYYVSDRSVPDGRRLLRTEIDTSDVGRAMLTSSVQDSFFAENITDSYKPKEGTQEEREQVRHAIRSGVAEDRSDVLSLFNLHRVVEIKDVEFEMSDLDAVTIGEDIVSKLVLRNTSEETRTARIQLEVNVMQYTGKIDSTIFELFDELSIKPNTAETFGIKVDAKEYSERIGEHSQMCVTAFVHVIETDQIFNAKDVFQVIKPQLIITLADSKITLNEAATVIVQLVNPYGHQSLTNCNLYLEGAGIARQLAVEIPRVLEAGKTLTIEQVVFPRRPGKRRVLAAFNSDQLSNVRGVLKIDVSG
uniref:Transglutaminase-like domain-containing protein n=1 Tax=Plectus sambesii TaxID=2011161 RepID=A0A914XK01_9BILA